MQQLLYCILGILHCAKVSDGSYHEQRLLDHLLSQPHITEMRPVLDDRQSVTVKIGLSLNQIVDVDEKNQVVTTSVWTRQEWKNEYLRWNSSDYGNITSINVQSSAVWIPDLVLYDNADEDVEFRGLLDSLETRVQIRHDGTNKWLAPVMLKSKCKINVRYFPFDSQNCSLKFGSWTYDLKRIDVRNESDSVDLGKYIESGEWRLVTAPVIRHEVKYYCCPELYPDVTFYLIIKRRTLFYLTNLILPLVVVSVLIVFVFLLPPQSGERISLSITLLLTMMVFMLMISETIPATSEVVPLVAKFYIAVMVEMAAALVITCYVLMCYHSRSNTIPQWMKRYLIGKLGDFFSVTKSDALKELEKREKEEREKKQNIGFLQRIMRQAKRKKTDTDEYRLGNMSADYNCNNHQSSIEENSDDTKTKVANHLSRVEDPVAKEVLRKLDIISENIIGQEKDNLIQEQWLVIATVTDHVAMWAFTVVIILTIISIFYQAPGYVS